MRLRKRYLGRCLRVEALEQRLPLAGDVVEFTSNDWHNESNALDVNGDGYARPIDAQRVLNLLGKYGSGTVDAIQEAWGESDSSAADLAGGFHPDVSGDGSVSPLDVLRVVNHLDQRITADPTVGLVSVMPDDQGRPVSVMFTAADGRTKSVNISDATVTVSWTDGDVFVTRSDGMPLVIAKPSVGILEADYSADDGQATVTRYESDGSVTVERYMCVPGWNDNASRQVEVILFAPEDGIFVVPDDVRRPIDGFEEVLGAIVSRETTYDDGSTVVYKYEEAAAENLLSITTTLPTGESASANSISSQSSFRIDPSQVESGLWKLLNNADPLISQSKVDELSALAGALIITGSRDI